MEQDLADAMDHAHDSHIETQEERKLRHCKLVFKDSDRLSSKTIHEKAGKDK